MRVFVSIDINEETRQRLIDVQKKLSRTGARLKLVEPENIHLTIKFLGEVEEVKVPSIEEALQHATAGTKPFEMVVSGIGVFPNQNYVRVVWAGVSGGSEEVLSIQRNIDGELEKLGFPKDTNFIPHITLSRVKSLKRKEDMLDFLRETAKEEFGKTCVREISLKQSTLTPKGPIYTTLARIELGK